MPNPTVLSLQDVTIRYGDAVAVDALCLDVRRGEIFGLLGPNGSGKSSTLSAVTGALTPTAGTIRVEGWCERDDPLAYRRRIGLAPQELAFYEEMTAEENLRFFGRLYGLNRRDLCRRVGETLQFVRLTEQARRPARTYSGGMKRRLNLACACSTSRPCCCSTSRRSASTCNRATPLHETAFWRLCPGPVLSSGASETGALVWENAVG